MAYYNMQGPAQYAQHQESRRDQQMSNMLQMMMQMKAFKQRQKEFDIKQEAATSAEEWQRQVQKQTMDYRQFLMDPVAQQAMAKHRALGTEAGKGPELPKPKAILPAPMREWLKTPKGGGYSDEQLNQLDDTTKRQLMRAWREARKPATLEKPPTSQTAFLNKINTNINRQINRIAKKKGAIATPNVFSGGFDFDFGEDPEPLMVSFLQGAKGLVTNWVNTTTERKLSGAEMNQARKVNSFLTDLHKYEDDIEKFLADPTTPPEMKTPEFIFGEYLNFKK